MTGFVIGLILVAMFIGIFGLFVAEMDAQYTTYGEDSKLLKQSQNYTDTILAQQEEIKDKTDLSQDAGALDIIGAYFSSGWAAVKTAGNSIQLFEGMMFDAQEDNLPGQGLVFPYITMIIIVIIIVGIFMAVLVKWRL